MPSFVETLAAARDGESAARDALFRQFYPAVQGMVHRWLAADVRSKHPRIASMLSTGDVVQDVFMSVIRDLGCFDGEDERVFVKYLATLVRNRILDTLRRLEATRRDGRRNTESDTAIGSTIEDRNESDPARLAEVRESASQLARAVSALPERERRLMELRLDSSWAFKDIASCLDFPSPDAARQAFRMTRARLLATLSVGDTHRSRGA